MKPPIVGLCFSCIGANFSNFVQLTLVQYPILFMSEVTQV